MSDGEGETGWLATCLQYRDNVVSTTARYVHSVEFGVDHTFVFFFHEWQSCLGDEANVLGDHGLTP